MSHYPLVLGYMVHMLSLPKENWPYFSVVNVAHLRLYIGRGGME